MASVTPKVFCTTCFSSLTVARALTLTGWLQPCHSTIMPTILSTAPWAPCHTSPFSSSSFSFFSTTPC